MSEQKKFGTFAGVFTPSILTILGVIMYLRLGWVVGNAGLWGTISIIIVAHIISVSTGLSVSSISTDKKVGAGGVYYVLSRSLGLPIGGALGITLFVATAFSIALYMIGFAEIFNNVFDFGFEKNDLGELIQTTNAKRITASIGLLALTIVALISTAVALKTQFIILALIILSLFAIFFGDRSLASTSTLATSIEKVSWFEVFAIFFPAVTGFTAGVAMSGDLKDPKKSIPIGTMSSIAVGFVVYMVLGLFLYYNFTDIALITNDKLLYEITWFGGIFVIMGVWGATLSSALGGILGGPRILQAMSVDKITPKLFAKGVGQDNEPRNALILTVLIAEAGILIGELDIIAEIVSMFYLAAYGFINLSFFLESWASADFNPTFKVKKWVGLLGFIATFTVMSQLNLLAMVAAFVIIGGIYFYLNKKQVALGTGDIWQSVWSTIVKKGLRKMEAGNDHKRNWKPNILLFSGGTDRRSKLIEFSKSIAGQAGIITNFDLIENDEAKVLFPKSKQRVKDDELDKFGIFGRQIEVQNEFKGIESIASTFGFSGIEPNTILMPWPGETKDPVWFTEMTQKLIDLDYNVLYLDYDKRWGYRKKEQIDLWWRGFGNNAELMLSLVKFIKNSPDWVRAKIRILLVNETNTDNRLIEKRITDILDQFRIVAEVKIINNAVDKKPIYELMKIHSANADLVFIGIPEIEDGTVADFVDRTNTLVNTIGTTLLIKASSQFDDTDLKIEHISLRNANKDLDTIELVELEKPINNYLQKEIEKVDLEFEKITKFIAQSAAQRIEDFHHKLINQNIAKLDGFLTQLNSDADIDSSVFGLEVEIDKVLKAVRDNHNDACHYQLDDVYETFKLEFEDFLKQRDSIILRASAKVELNKKLDAEGHVIDKKTKISFQSKLQHAWINKGISDLKEGLLEFGYQNFILLHQSKNVIHTALWDLIENVHQTNDIKQCALDCKKQIDKNLKEIDKHSLNINEGFYKFMRQVDRNLLNALINSLEYRDHKKKFQETFPTLDNKVLKKINLFIDNYPHYWKRNIILFTYHLQADLYLIQYSTKVEDATDKLLNNTDKEFTSSISNNISILEKELNILKELIESDNKQEINSFFMTINDDVYFSQERLVNDLFQHIQQAIDKLPEEVELMDAKSLNDIRKEQGDKVTTHKIQLDDIAEYITKASYVKPIQDQLAQYFVHLKRVMALLLNSSFVVSTQIENFSKNENIDELIKSLKIANEDVEEAKALLKSFNESFHTEVKNVQKLLGAELEINKIIDQYDILNQSVKSKKQSKTWLAYQNFKKKSFDGLQSITQKIIHTKLDASTLKYQEKFEGVKNINAELLDFNERVSPIGLVNEELPFYYQQLFAGKHISDSYALKSRQSDFDAINTTIKRIDNGINGAIIIVGENMQGKSFVANHTVNHLIEGKVYRINPINKLNSMHQLPTKNDLHLAFQKATGLKENINKILNKTDVKSVFLIEDVEQWWLRSPNGNVVIDELSKLIEKYGNRHYFILTSNIYAFESIKQTTIIQDSLIKTIVLTPLNSSDLVNILEHRHQLGGLEFVHNDVPEQFMSESKRRKLFLKFYQSSKGNVGLAMRQWIANIIDIDENKITISDDFNFDFPELTDDLWKNILYQFQLHKNLNRTELYAIYGIDNKAWINRVIASMLKVQLLKTIEKNTFEINPIMKPYVESYLYA
jgi:amino acid transporter